MASELIASPWRTVFENFISSARHELWLAAPFYNTDTIKLILTKPNKGVSKRFLLALSEDAVRTGFQSTAAIRIIRDDKSCEVQFIKNLHAKVLIMDKKRAIVTSSNLTNAGLDSNVEMGILVDDPQTVGDLIRQFHALGQQSKAISENELHKYESFSVSRQGGKTGKSFGGVVSLGKRPTHPSPVGAVAKGWILIHSSKKYNSPQDDLAKCFKPGDLWHWNRGKPMKEGGPHTLLLAYRKKIFGQAETSITHNIAKNKRRQGFNFAFKLWDYIPLAKEIPFSKLMSEKRAKKHRDLIKLDDEILDAYNRAKCNEWILNVAGNPLRPSSPDRLAFRKKYRERHQ